MEVFRLARARHRKKLSGRGAAIKGARWNSIGTEVIYTAVNRSLAMAEVSVHLTLATLPTDFYMLTIFIPDGTSMQTITPEELPKNWNQFPHISATQEIGDAFIRENKYCLLKVPSAVTQGDFNILINPCLTGRQANHTEFKKIRIVEGKKFPFDERVFR